MVDDYPLFWQTVMSGICKDCFTFAVLFAVNLLSICSVEQTKERKVHARKFVRCVHKTPTNPPEKKKLLAESLPRLRICYS